MAKTIKSPACKNGNPDKLQNELIKIAQSHERNECTYLTPRYATVSAEGSSIGWELETNTCYGLPELLTYTHKLIKFMADEYNIEIELMEYSPTFDVDVDSWYDSTTVNITFKIEFIIKKWSMFDDFLVCAEETRLLEEAKAREAARAKRAANKQAKIDKEIKERQLLADLKLKYPDA